MTFPTGTTIPTTNLDSPDDDPSLARADLYNLVVAFNNLVASENSASGVLVLNGSGKIPSSYLPGSIVVTGTLALQPSNGITSINAALRLSQIVTADLGTATGTTAPSAGDLVYLTDGDAGQPCLGCYDGSKWRIVRFMTQVGDVGAVITSTASISATAD